MEFVRRGLRLAATALLGAAQAALAEQREMPANDRLEAEGGDGFLADVLDGVLHRVSHEDQVEVF